MERGLLAPLSPNEEVTLRRISQGSAQSRSLREGDVVRLKKLNLIEERRTGLALTAIGQKRIGRVTWVPPDATTARPGA